MKSRFRLFSLALASLALSGCVVVPPRHYGGPPQAHGSGQWWCRAVCRSGAGDALRWGRVDRGFVELVGRAPPLGAGCWSARAMAAGTGTESVELVQ